MLSLRHKKQSSKNVADTVFTILETLQPGVNQRIFQENKIYTFKIYSHFKTPTKKISVFFQARLGTSYSDFNSFLMIQSSPPEVFWKGVLKICSKFTGEHPCWSVISCEFCEIFKSICFFIEHLCWAIFDTQR